MIIWNIGPFEAMMKIALVGVAGVAAINQPELNRVIGGAPQ